MRRASLVPLAVLCATLALARTAAAYRPFDGTDAAVAATGEFELELGPVHYYRNGTSSELLEPIVVLNLGVAPRLEVIADFQDRIAEDPAGHASRASLRGTDLKLKWLALEGVLQDERGASLAFEGGVLTPEFGGANGVGAQLDGIVSLRLRTLTLHFNEQVALTRSQQLDLFSGLILEAPMAWPARPVGELFLERVGQGPLSRSALLGVIWPAAPSLAVDTGVRAAREDGRATLELRLGFTWQTEWWRH